MSYQHAFSESEYMPYIRGESTARLRTCGTVLTVSCLVVSFIKTSDMVAPSRSADSTPSQMY